MKQISQHGLMSLGGLAIVLAMTALARSDDSPVSMLQANDAPPGRAPLAPGDGQSSANKEKKDGSALTAPSPDNAQTTPSTPDYRSEAGREESAASVATSYVPNMIGDMGGGPRFQILIGKVGEAPRFLALQAPSPSASLLGAQRLADNDCTLPTDRVFSDYSYFHDAQLATPSDANRFVPGFEKTFLDGCMSVEMRFPMGVLESNDIVANNSVLGMTGQFGDIQVIVKAILLQEDTWTLGMGMGISIPTAPDVNIGAANGGQLMKIANNSTHLLPYVGLLVKPNDDWFAQAFVQVDVAANGDSVSANLTGNGLTSVGDIYDQSLVFADVAVGRWLYRNPDQRFSGLAAVVETHYTGGLNAPSTVQANGFSIGYNTPKFNVLDLIVGAHAVVGQTTITAGFATPATDDRGFDGEFRFFVNRKF